MITELWTIVDFASLLNVSRPTAYRRVKKFMAAGMVEKVSVGKRGRPKGVPFKYARRGMNVGKKLARYRFLPSIHFEEIGSPS
jgi:predicted transcriptional regulator